MSKVESVKPNAVPYVMPKPSQLVLWRHVPGGDPSPAIVTGVGRNAISVMVFPTDSRVGFPKQSVIHVSDPRVKTLVSPDAGVWDHTDEHKLLIEVAEHICSSDDPSESLRDRLWKIEG